MFRAKWHSFSATPDPSGSGRRNTDIEKRISDFNSAWKLTTKHSPALTPLPLVHFYFHFYCIILRCKKLGINSWTSISFGRRAELPTQVHGSSPVQSTIKNYIRRAKVAGHRTGSSVISITKRDISILFSDSFSEYPETWRVTFF